eukprot:TRINITY_DN21784_c0_g1_i1.p1 TRINITY_DN21784_c0_g1~~TRINITY_DN21784_c0_g1_i1.p1  ORF type:complete len:543 (-),score=119.88 TRINITY_DN21784_c0_g1_i1:8-1636(-)
MDASVINILQNYNRNIHLYESYRNLDESEKGLDNFRGENNCFINVVIQSLWHLDSFRKAFSSRPREHKHVEPCVFCALEAIFTQYEFSDEATIPPTILREALAALYKPHDRFQMFQLADAAEAFDAVLNCLHQELSIDGVNGSLRDKLEADRPDECLDKSCIAHQVFGIRSVEQVRCEACGTSSAARASLLHTAIAYAVTLREAYVKDPNASFCKLLNMASEEKRLCPDKECGNLCSLSHYVQSLPTVFSVGIVWDSAEPTVPEIDMILRMISSRINLNNVFLMGNPHTNPKGKKPRDPNYYKFRGMICYYGKHYTAYFYNHKSTQWYVYDDTQVKPVATEWPSVRDRCLRGRLQPNIVFYERESDHISDIEQEEPDLFQSIMELTHVKISKFEPSDIEAEIQAEISAQIRGHLDQPTPSPPLPSSDEDTFVIISRDEDVDTLYDVDFMVLRTNWLYRKQERRYRLSREHFLRIIPGLETVKESFNYTDVLDVTLTDPSNMIIRFYSGKEEQYLQTQEAALILKILQHRAALQGNAFTVKRL